MPQKNGGRGKDQDTFRYEILRHYGILSTSKRGWTRELNLICWNGREPKYDLRDWNPDHDKMSKGITLTEEELMLLMSLMEENQICFTKEEKDAEAVSAGEEEKTEDASSFGEELTGAGSSRFESKAAEEKAYADAEISGETGTRDFAGELYEAETA